MGFFGNNENKVNKELENARKYVETIFGTVSNREQFEIEIAKRIESGRIIKDIKFNEDGGALSALIIYDSWAEKARAEKERAKDRGLGR